MISVNKTVWKKHCKKQTDALLKMFNSKNAFVIEVKEYTKDGSNVVYSGFSIVHKKKLALLKNFMQELCEWYSAEQLKK